MRTGSGQAVRYNVSAKAAAHQALDQWRREGRLVPICPELTTEFSVPRPPTETSDGESGQRVLASAAPFGAYMKIFRTFPGPFALFNAERRLSTSSYFQGASVMYRMKRA
jgi:hypothetical protein